MVQLKMLPHPQPADDDDGDDEEGDEEEETDEDDDDGSGGWSGGGGGGGRLGTQLHLFAYEDRSDKDSESDSFDNYEEPDLDHLDS